MYVEKIQSNRFKKNFYKVIFTDKGKLEKFMEVLAFYKENVIDELHPEPGDITLDSYVLLNDKVNSINPDSEEELSFILHEVQDILTLFLNIMQLWYLENQIIKQKDEIIRKLRALYEVNDEISKTDDAFEEILQERNYLNLEILSKYLHAAHEDPTILQGETWEHIKSYIESAKKSKS